MSGRSDHGTVDAGQRYTEDQTGRKRPCILVSACLLGVSCRYNGKGELHEGVLRLGQEATLIPVCPEIYGGLATPRDPAERKGDQVLTDKGADVTAQYRKGAEAALHLARLSGCCCAVLKERSPSCGCGQIYDGTHTRTLIPGSGVTAELLLQHGIPVFGESETEQGQILYTEKCKIG